MSESAYDDLEDRLYTLDEYFALEASSEERFEFIDGQITMMAGESDSHSVINTNVISLLRVGLMGGPCRPLSPDMRIRFGRRARFGYADTAVVCGPRIYEDSTSELKTLLNPTLIVETLSTSTETYTRGDKFTFYRDIETLREYVMIKQHEPRIETFFREDDGAWRIATFDGMDARVPLTSLNIELLARDVYSDVEFRQLQKPKRK